MTTIDLGRLRWDDGGLVAVIAQDAGDGRVLMLGYADRAAMEATVDTGELHFHSRSRGRLWRKGETSGNVLRVTGLAVDCDGDAILAQVEPAGPTCHTGARSCFDSPPDADAPTRRPRAAESASQGFAWLEQLWTTIDDRASQRPVGSYTASLLQGGVNAVARKVAEEATEVVLAARDDADGADPAVTKQALAGEAADLLFHLLVLLAERGVPPAEVVSVLRGRDTGTRLEAISRPDAAR